MLQKQARRPHRTLHHDHSALATTTVGTASPDDGRLRSISVAEARRRFKCAGQLFASTDLLTPLGPKALWTEIRNASGSNCLLCDLGSWTIGSMFGRLVTWVALLFGASFWYDALRRLVGLKGKLTGGNDGAG